ncbi:tetratricopeptide repeat protein [Spirosoma fluviale]|nr:hypothetical protein [Spirosoma fluviale]
MTEPQRVAFDAELEQNPLLREEVDHQRTIQRGMQLLAYKREAADMLKRINVSMDDEIPSGSQSGSEPENDLDRSPLVKPLWGRPMAWVAAASVVMLLGLFIYLLQQPTRTGSKTPVAQTDRPTPPVNNRPPSDSIPTSTPVDSASTAPPVDPANADHLLADAFFRASPKNAPVFSPGPDTDAAAPDDSAAVAIDSANVLRGASLLKRRRDQEAATILQQIVLEGYPGHWRATAEWYLSLAYLRIDKPREARAILSRIARTKGHPYEAEARRLKKEMM